MPSSPQMKPLGSSFSLTLPAPLTPAIQAILDDPAEADTASRRRYQPYSAEAAFPLLAFELDDVCSDQN